MYNTVNKNKIKLVANNSSADANVCAYNYFSVSCSISLTLFISPTLILI